MRMREWLLVPAALACGGCGLFGGEQARGGGLEGEALTLAGALVYPDGRPASGARVYLRSKDDPDLTDAKRGEEVASGTAAPDGRYRITGIPPGEYFLNAEDGKNSGLFQMVQLGTTQGAPRVVTLAEDTLKGKGSIRGRILLPSDPSRPLKGTIQVAGLGRAVSVDSTGAIAIDSMAPGEYSMRIIYNVLNAYHRLEHVVVESGEVTDIGAFTLTEPAKENLAEWPHVLPVRIDATAGGESIRGTVPGFPLLIRLDSANFPFAQVGVPMDGGDLRFTDGSGKRLDANIESWDFAARKAAVWVKLDSLVGDRNDQVVRIHFGKTDVFANSSPPRVFDTANGFAAAWHFSDLSPGGLMSDATSNRTHLRSSGSGIEAGFIGLGYRFRPGISTQGSGVLPQSASFTISAWVRPEGPQGMHARLIWKKAAANNTAEYSLTWLGREPAVEFMVSGKSGPSAAKAALPGGEAWIHLAAAFDGHTGTGALYLNGKPVGGFSGGSGFGYASDAGTTYFGVQAGESNPFNGIMDEIRVYRNALSPDRIALEYASQKTGSKLAVFP